ncbi:SIS domain-containing protein [Arthrobacter subterraneus]|uniref:SIS domain-containing protein n=1 Tax=Arthrobacter subterraneus TaxID=335973 RepID=UPI00380E75D0
MNQQSTETSAGVPLGEPDMVPGIQMRREIAEQPDCWRRLISDGAADIAAIARRISERSPRFVLFAARGTSDHAALYGKYLAEIRYGKPSGLASPSTASLYGSDTDHRDVLMIAVSQSGGSPDVLESVQAVRRGGGVTVAVTNNAQSPLARAAEFSIDVLAGRELAVAATKSYTSQLLALYLLFCGLTGMDSQQASRLADLGSELLGAEPEVAGLAHRLRYADRLVTTARGYSYPTAREAALKLMETSYVSAQAFSAADLMHGPLAMIDREVPVLAVRADGAGGRAMQEPLQRLRSDAVDVFSVGTPEAVAASSGGVTLPGGVPEELSPLLEILPFQYLALHLSLQRGENPDTPRGLRKVTETL